MKRWLISIVYVMWLAIPCVQGDSSQAGKEERITSFKKSLQGCTDPLVGSRTRYQLGTEYFKAGRYADAEKEFRVVVEDAKSPGSVKALSWNMLGQLHRMKGNDKASLEAFEAMMKILMDAGGKRIRSEFQNPGYFQLLCIVALERAEIMDAREDVTGSLREYDRLRTWLDTTSQQVQNRYGPLVLDRMSQGYLRRGNLDAYLDCSDKILRQYPDYDRAAVVKLESTCARFAQRKKVVLPLRDGSMAFPARVIAATAGSFDPELTAEVKRIYEESAKSRWNLLVGYHYAWLLDVQGRGQQAVEVFAELVRLKTIPPELSIIPGYAKIQYALLLCDQPQFKQAMELVRTVTVPPGNTHVSTLLETVKQNIQTHLREHN